MVTHARHWPVQYTPTTYEYIPRFAFLPVKCKNERVWLKTYYLKYGFGVDHGYDVSSFHGKFSKAECIIDKLTQY